MSNPTTPFGWQMPTSTDLVTDLPADFEVFGQAVATSMGDLLGGTTGQILSKATNADMDFTWTSANPGDITGVTAGTGISGGGTSGDVTVTNTMATAIDAKGDLIAGTADNAFSRVAVGTNGQYLQADSTAATGVKWATVAAAPTANSVYSSGQQSSSATSFTAFGSNIATSVTTGTKALIILSARLDASVTTKPIYLGVAVSGATTRAAEQGRGAVGRSPSGGADSTEAAVFTGNIFLTGLTAGSNTFTVQNFIPSGTLYASQIQLTVIDMGS